VGTAILNLSGDLADPLMLGLLHANEPDLEVEIEIIQLDDDWFDSPIVDDAVPLDPTWVDQLIAWLRTASRWRPAY
jgi:hypothetical protein